MTLFAASTMPRAEPRICTRCGCEVRPGQLFRVEGPRHAFCDPPPRLDVARIAQAARKR